MKSMLRGLARRWADNQHIKANDDLRRTLIRSEAANERLEQTVDRLRLRRALDRDVRVRAEVEVEQLTRANLKLSGLLTDLLARPAAPEATVDPDAVVRALKARQAAAEKIVHTRRARVAAQAVYSNAYLRVYIDEGGPEHLRKAIAEDRASVERADLAAAEVDELAAEEGKRLAELGWRSAMAGAAAPEAGE